MGKQERMPQEPPVMAGKGGETRKAPRKKAAAREAPAPLQAAEPVEAAGEPRPRGRNKRSEDTIRQILVAAEQVILESGVERVAILDVCEVAGLSRGTFYRYFSSQEELLDAFSAHKRERFHLALHAATAPYQVPEERFKALIAYLDNYLKHSKARRLLEVAPEFAFGFFKRIFHDSIERFQEVLGIVFDAWDARLGVKLDRELVCEMLIRYVLSELLVPRKGDRRALLASVAAMTAALASPGVADAGLAPLSAPAAGPAPAPLQPVGATREAGRNRRSEETINQILAATETVILESGVERVSIQDVCEAAAISRGTFYRYFKAQDDLLDAYTQHKRNDFHLGLQAAVLAHGDPDQRFIAMVAYLDHFLRVSKARRLLEVAPAYAFRFFQRGFDDSVARFTALLDISYQAWETRLGIRLDRALISEMLLRYMLSEMLVQGEHDRRQVPQRVAALVGSLAGTRHGGDGGDGADVAAAVAGEPGGLLAQEPAAEPPPGAETGRNRRSDQTIAQILDAAEQVVLETGVERVSILAVCEAAGVSRGTFYRYFKSQDELLDAFTENQRQRFHQSLTAVAQQFDDPQLRFHAVIDHMDAFIRRDKVRRLLKVAPEYAFSFFQRTFNDAISRYKTVLAIVFDAWEQRLGRPIDRDFACELMVRYMLSELLVPTDARKPLLPRQLEKMFGAIMAAQED